MKFKSFCPAKETIIRVKTAYRIENRNVYIFTYVSGEIKLKNLEGNPQIKW